MFEKHGPVRVDELKAAGVLFRRSSGDELETHQAGGSGQSPEVSGEPVFGAQSREVVAFKDEDSRNRGDLPPDGGGARFRLLRVTFRDAEVGDSAEGKEHRILRILQQPGGAAEFGADPFRFRLLGRKQQLRQPEAVRRLKDCHPQHLARIALHDGENRDAEQAGEAGDGVRIEILRQQFPFFEHTLNCGPFDEFEPFGFGQNQVGEVFAQLTDSD